MCGNSYLATKFQYRAGGAIRPFAGTNVFSKRHEQTVDVDPLFLWNLLFECLHGLLRCFCLHKAPAVGNPVHMYIYTYARVPAGYAQSKISTFWAYTFQGCKLFIIGRNVAPIFV